MKVVLLIIFIALFTLSAWLFGAKMAYEQESKWKQKYEQLKEEYSYLSYEYQKFKIDTERRR